MLLAGELAQEVVERVEVGRCVPSAAVPRPQLAAAQRARRFGVHLRVGEPPPADAVAQLGGHSVAVHPEALGAGAHRGGAVTRLIVAIERVLAIYLSLERAAPVGQHERRDQIVPRLAYACCRVYKLSEAAEPHAARAEADAVEAVEAVRISRRVVDLKPLLACEQAAQMLERPPTDEAVRERAAASQDEGNAPRKEALDLRVVPAPPLHRAADEPVGVAASRPRIVRAHRPAPSSRGRDYFGAHAMCEQARYKRHTSLWSVLLCSFAHVCLPRLQEDPTASSARRSIDRQRVARRPPSFAPDAR